MKKLIILSIITLLCSQKQSVAQYFGLEGSVPSGWMTSEGSELSISNLHYKLGKESLRWDWKNDAEITIQNPLNINKALHIKNGGLRMWVYNEKALNSKIKFELGFDNEVGYQFEYAINFTGWRACWITFKDMQGKGMKKLNYMKIHAPDDMTSGQLFFDRMIFPSVPLERRMTPDAQLPYINPRAKNNHWTALWYWYDTYKHDLPLPESICTSEKDGMALIHERIIEAYKGEKPTANKISKIKKGFKKFNIKRKNGRITGKPFVSKDEYEKKLGDVKMEHIGKSLLGLAKIYFHTHDVEAKQMFYDLLDYTMDQGLESGSGFGTNHHYGFQFRAYPPAIYLMKESLAEDGKLKRVAAMLTYWTGVQEYREKPVVGTLQGIVDSWNTSVVPRLLAIMTLEDTPAKLRELQAVKRWMDISLKIVPGTVGGIKEDGTGFHHGGLYPAYCKGGYSGIGLFLSFVNDTPFALSDEARTNFGKALLCMRNYSNHLDWGFGICGRHPLNGTMNPELVEAFAHLAKSGDPQSDSKIWKKMAEAYLRLEIKDTPLKREFLRMGLQAEGQPDGNYTYNYGALGIHRRGNWMVSLKGYNKDVWGSEIYVKDNRYGRYQSYGTVQVIGNSKHLSAEESGFVQEGWDWNRYPGATSIHLPLKKLDSPMRKTLMEKSDEGFAGASNLSGTNGIFGMKLREKDRKNFTGDHQANKSGFCFEDRIICLGTQVSNSNKEHRTETTLFQLHLGNQSDQLIVDGEVVGEFPYQNSLDKKSDHYLMDNSGNGYWVRKGLEIKLAKQNQNSRHNKTRKETHGDFASAWIDHGMAPENQSYEYVLLPGSTTKKLKRFAKAMKDEKTAPYKVLKQDSINHIVWDRATNTTGFVFFEANNHVDHHLLKSISASSLLMIKESINGEKLTLSICDPDLHLSEERYTTAEASTPIRIQMKIVGEWNLSKEQGNCQILKRSKGVTSIEFTCINGIPIEIDLEKH